MALVFGGSSTTISSRNISFVFRGQQNARATMKSHHMLHISPILPCPLGADMLHRRPYPSSEECRTPKTPTAHIPPPHRRRHPIRSPYFFPAVPFPTLRARPSANLPPFFDPLIGSSMPPQLLLFSPSFFLFLPRMRNRLCVLQFRTSLPTSYLIHSIPPCSLFPHPPIPNPRTLVFYHHRFPYLLPHPSPSTPTSLSLPQKPTINLPRNRNPQNPQNTGSRTRRIRAQRAPPKERRMDLFLFLKE